MLKPKFTCSWKYWIAGMIMFLFILVTVWALIVLIAVGVIMYFLVLIIVRDEMVLDLTTKFVFLIKSLLKRPFKTSSKEEHSDNNINEAADLQAMPD